MQNMQTTEKWKRIDEESKTPDASGFARTSAREEIIGKLSRALERLQHVMENLLKAKKTQTSLTSDPMARNMNAATAKEGKKAIWKIEGVKKTIDKGIHKIAPAAQSAPTPTKRPSSSPIPTLRP